MRGSPTPTEILIKVVILPAGPPTRTEDTPAPGNVLGNKTHGPFRRYSVGYAINPSDITFMRTSDGKIHSNFELAIFVFNPEGVLVNSTTTSLHTASTLEEIKKNVAQGIHYQQEISAPAKGEYFLRVVVHDIPRNRFGAVEVATSEVKNLPPPAAAPPPSTPSPSPAATPVSNPAPPQ
jgi:hypothetical protein